MKSYVFESLFLVCFLGKYAIVECDNNSTKHAIFSISKLQSNCPYVNKRKLSAIIENSTITMQDSISYLTLKVRIIKDFPEDMDLIMEMVKCKTKEYQNSCEKYHDFTIPKVCRFLKLKGPWAPYLSALEPPLPCPIKKGVYRTPNRIRLSTEGIPSFILTSGSFYKMSIKTVDSKTKEILSCTVCDGAVRYV
ncbi:uncharacterized protein LOC143193039 [Rhynchophorus ferrugineus]|uniref:uncharacterized protein LOC143193039 n=1 Tax=Rhynchophorus ferrugineus TaxID=354439 RepID=UPI003FCEBF2A